MSITKEQATNLRKPFPPESIGKLPKGGVMLDYVGHAAVTDRLLTVDPEWSWEPFALDENGLPALDGGRNLWIRLTICGVTRIGVGDGKSAKECIGDAIRNAAMRFGVALDLWAKEDLVEFARHATAPKPAKSLTEVATEAAGEPVDPETGEVGPDAQSPMTGPAMRSNTRARMFALFSEAGVTGDDEQRQKMSKALGREVESRASLTEAEAQVVIEKTRQLIEWQKQQPEGGAA